jgi:hypothetical protein
MRVTTVGVCIALLSVGFVALNAQKPPVPATPLNVLTFHNNNQRTGLNALERTLTPANVNAANFGKVNFLATDGQLYGEPLYVSGVSINGTTHRVVYVATEHDSVYAFDADQGTQLWKKTTLLSGEVSSSYPNCGLVSPEIGITSTPVIDFTKGPHGAIYVVATSQDAQKKYHQRVHALDLVTGAEILGGPVEITGRYPGTGDNSQNGYVIFDPAQYLQRAALLEVSNKVYIAFSSHCDERPYTGWIMQYSASTLQQLSVLNLTPNGSEGSIWQSGGGLAADSDGYIYVLVANGTFDTTLNAKGFPINGDYGNSFVKLSGDTPMKVADYFTMYNGVDESEQDLDFGSGAPIIVDFESTSPTNPTVQVAIGAGKDGNIYVAQRDDMGKWTSNNDNALYQELDGVVYGGIFSTPAFFNNTLYFGPEDHRMVAFPVVKGYIGGASSHSTTIYGPRGANPSISANGSTSGIVWTQEFSKTDPGVLHAYDALDLSKELYNSNQAGSRDQYGLATKFITPMIANGKVYLSTPTGVAVFGLLHSQ